MLEIYNLLTKEKDDWMEERTNERDLLSYVIIIIHSLKIFPMNHP